MQNSDSQKKSASAWLIWVLVACGVLIFVGTIVLLVGGILSEESWEVRGVRGDFFGGHIASGASAAATFFLIAALLMQKRDLDVQQRHLQNSIEELRLSREVARESQEQMKKQALAAERTQVTQQLGLIAEAINRQDFRDSRIETSLASDEMPRSHSAREILKHLVNTNKTLSETEKKIWLAIVADDEFDQGIQIAPINSPDPDDDSSGYWTPLG